MSCLENTAASVFNFLLLATIRPFVLTPHILVGLMAGNVFGVWLGTLIVLGAVFSTALVYLLAKLIGYRIVTPWIASDLPQTLSFLRSQNWKIILVSRLIPFLPFDIMTILFGLLRLSYEKRTSLYRSWNYT